MVFPALASNLPQSLLRGKDPEFTPRNVNVLRLKLLLGDWMVQREAEVICEGERKNVINLLFKLIKINKKINLSFVLLSKLNFLRLKLKFDLNIFSLD